MSVLADITKPPISFYSEKLEPEDYEKEEEDADEQA